MKVCLINRKLEVWLLHIILNIGFSKSSIFLLKGTNIPNYTNYSFYLSEPSLSPDASNFQVRETRYGFTILEYSFMNYVPTVSG